MKRRRTRAQPARYTQESEQLPLSLSRPKPHAGPDPEDAAQVAIARRTRPSAVPGNVKLTLTLDVPRALPERLS